MEALRVEADDSAKKVEDLTAKVKVLEQENLQKEHEITSLQHRNSVLDKEVERLEGLHKDAKSAADDSHSAVANAESDRRKLQILEEEQEQTEKHLRETTEKYGNKSCLDNELTHIRRLRQTDIKAGHYERKVAALEQENTALDTKYEDMVKKYTQTKKELDDFAAELGNI